MRIKCDKTIIDNGFTFVELLIVLTTIGIIAALVLPKFIISKENARELEVKANLHLIQIALERYATDHDGQYPKQIWGGDKKGWTPIENVGCRTMWQSEPYNGTNERTARPPFDPLVHFGYLDSYPRNPFINKGEGTSTTIRWTAPPPFKPGDGDPRFGFSGEIMGNTLEDPRYLWKRYPTGQISLTRIKNCFLSEAFSNHSSMIYSLSPGNPFYSMGGIPVWQRLKTRKTSGVASSKRNNNIAMKAYWASDLNNTMKAYWAGEFFYRSGGVFQFENNLDNDYLKRSKLRYIWDFPYSRIDKYLLCGYGSYQTDGIDVIRLTDGSSNAVNNLMGYGGGGLYNSNPNFAFTEQTAIRFSCPEVFGGGEKGVMPYFPYLDPETGDWLYGAPDGYSDGVVVVLTNQPTVSEW